MAPPGPWGALHGLFLLAERGVRTLTGEAPWTRRTPAATLGWLVTFLGVMVTWVFFRAQDFPMAMKTLASMAGVFGAQGDQILATRDLIGVFVIVAIVLGIHRLARDSSLEALVQRAPRWSVATAWIGMSIALLLTQGTGNAFIYFQF